MMGDDMMSNAVSVSKSFFICLNQEKKGCNHRRERRTIY